MRKFWAWVLVLALLVTGLVGCAPKRKVKIRQGGNQEKRNSNWVSYRHRVSGRR